MRDGTLSFDPTLDCFAAVEDTGESILPTTTASLPVNPVASECIQISSTFFHVEVLTKNKSDIPGS